MTKKGTIQSCLVCGGISKTIRFGAVSCRACAEFFRREVISKSALKKKCSGNCQVYKTGRMSCKNCRFQKCINIGMMENLVSSRIAVSADDQKSKSILRNLQDAYKQLERSRKKVFGLTERKIPAYCNYKEFDDVHKKDICLILDSFVAKLKSMSSIENDQEGILSNNFIIPFILLETGYRSLDRTSYILPNGQMYNWKQLDILYEGLDNAQTIRQPFWNSSNKVFMKPMEQLHPDREEMLFLGALIYWDFGISNQSDECIQACQMMRNQVIQELVDYLKSKSGNVDHSFRLVEVMSILQCLEKATNIIKNYGHVLKIYDLKGKEGPLFEIDDS